MINGEIQRLARTKLFERYKAIHRMQYNASFQRVFTIRDIRLGTPEVQVRPWLEQSLGVNINAPVIYALAVNEIGVATALRQAFVAARAVRPQQYKMPRDNAEHQNSTTLYVGRSNDIRKRLKQHLWQAPVGTYAINMRRWAPNVAGFVTVSVQPILGQPSSQTVQDIEDTLWSDLRPLFGKSGSR